MVTYEEVTKIVNLNAIYIDRQYKEIVIQDIFKIVNYGKKYPKRSETEEVRVPEDFSTIFASVYFHVDAYYLKT
jgi:hypothetical protein